MELNISEPEKRADAQVMVIQVATAAGEGQIPLTEGEIDVLLEMGRELGVSSPVKRKISTAANYNE